VPDLIEPLIDVRRKLPDPAILSELKDLEPLPDEDHKSWSSQKLWQRAHLFVALGSIAADRKLRDAPQLLLERACHGDPGELMRGLRHQVEAIYTPHWKALAQLCVKLSASRRPGTRLWSVHQLGVLREPGAIGALAARMADTSPLVREEADQALKMLCAEHPKLEARVAAAVKAVLDR
jgi:hypothetical protein